MIIYNSYNMNIIFLNSLEFANVTKIYQDFINNYIINNMIIPIIEEFVGTY